MKFSLLPDRAEASDTHVAGQFYAPWCDDPCTIVEMLQGIRVMVRAADFWRMQPDSGGHSLVQARANFALRRGWVTCAIKQVVDSGLLNPAGLDSMSVLTEVARLWRDTLVPLAARRAVLDVTLAHRVFWAVRNLEPDPIGVEELAARWEAGLPPSSALPAATFADQRLVRSQYRGLRLSVELMALDGRAAIDPLEPGWLQGDRPYLAGYLTEALSLYGRELTEDPLRPQAWAGLALVVPKIYGGDRFKILGGRSDVPARLCQAIGESADAVELLRWLSGSAGAQ